MTPRLQSGQVEALRWLGMLLMVLGHAGWILLDRQASILAVETFSAGSRGREAGEGGSPSCAGAPAHGAV
jgi:hypothetical protein